MKRGANLIKITDVTGHRSLEMLKTYSRDAEAPAALKCAADQQKAQTLADRLYWAKLSGCWRDAATT